MKTEDWKKIVISFGGFDYIYILYQSEFCILVCALLFAWKQIEMRVGILKGFGII